MSYFIWILKANFLDLPLLINAFIHVFFTSVIILYSYCKSFYIYIIKKKGNKSHVKYYI